MSWACLSLCFTECGPETSSLSTTWDLVGAKTFSGLAQTPWIHSRRGLSPPVCTCPSVSRAPAVAPPSRSVLHGIRLPWSAVQAEAARCVYWPVSSSLCLAFSAGTGTLPENIPQYSGALPLLGTSGLTCVHTVLTGSLRAIWLIMTKNLNSPNAHKLVMDKQNVVSPGNGIHSEIKKNGLLIRTTTCVSIENIVLSERTQTIDYRLCDSFYMKWL